MRRVLAAAALLTLLTTLVFAAPALADDGGVMQRLMGHDAYAAMVEHMRGVLGEQRAGEMLAQCEAAMASHEATDNDAQHMSGMMRMHRMHGGS